MSSKQQSTLLQGVEWAGAASRCLRTEMGAKVCQSSTTCSSLAAHGRAIRYHCYMSTGFCKIAVNESNWWGLRVIFSLEGVNIFADEEMRLVVDMAYECGEKAFGFIKQYSDDHDSIVDYITENYPSVPLK